MSWLDIHPLRPRDEYDAVFAALVIALVVTCIVAVVLVGLRP